MPRPSLVQITDKALMTQIGEQAIRAIQTRTRSGRDAEGRAFPAYSTGYARAKARELGASGTVNLTVSGDMLNGLQIIRATDTSVTLGWVREG